MNSHGGYIAKLLIVATVAAVAGKLALFNTVGCEAFDHDPANYMAYCNSSAHGHYDHAAFLYDLEPGVRDAVSAANVLVLGSSHIEVALSTEEFVKFERSHPDVRAYVMGFGYFEQNKFSAAVIRKLHPAPKIVVINADPFFSDSASVQSERLMNSPAVERANALSKRVWHTVSHAECVDGARSFVARHVCGTTGTWYRSRSDGRWILRAALVRIDSMRATAAIQRDSAADVYASHAIEFLKLLPVERRCVVITHVPDGIARSQAGAIATRIGATFISPRLEGLGTSDGSHLDSESAERWSVAFLVELEPILKSCL